ncbi:unnamed protein product [Acanthocheilonema viteae]|uniref:Uncharacterized protein n=1 Tax=Acanthocheilonema viteae TaxID=6277 RepID=A0A498S8P6_ACAVI|nr:unnamed protein product [Acanthocheilonema viteae]
MQKIFEKFRSGAKILATESNAEVEIVVKYSFKEKPETSSALPNERNWRTGTTRDVSNKSSHKRHSRKPLVKPSATYVQIRNPGSRSPPVSIKTGKKIRVSKSQSSTAQFSSSRILPVCITGSHHSAMS